MNISKSIQIALVKKGLKKKDLAAGLGVSATTISNLCNNKHCSSSMLGRLAKFFNMPTSKFIALGEEE